MALLKVVTGKSFQSDQQLSQSEDVVQVRSGQVWDVLKVTQDRSQRKDVEVKPHA